MVRRAKKYLIVLLKKIYYTAVQLITVQNYNCNEMRIKMLTLNELELVTKI